MSAPHCSAKLLECFDVRLPLMMPRAVFLSLIIGEHARRTAKQPLMTWGANTKSFKPDCLVVLKVCPGIWDMPKGQSWRWAEKQVMWCGSRWAGGRTPGSDPGPSPDPLSVRRPAVPSLPPMSQPGGSLHFSQVQRVVSGSGTVVPQKSFERSYKALQKTGARSGRMLT